VTFEEGSDKLSRKYGTKLPFNAVQNPKLAQVSYTLRWRPQIT